MKNKKKVYFLPKSKLGKISGLIVVLSIITLYLQYWIALIFNISISPIIGILPMIFLLIFGITPIFSVIKYKDYSIVLFISSLLGIFGIIFLIGEFLFSH